MFCVNKYSISPMTLGKYVDYEKQLNTFAFINIE
jgi:hypothetical protein